jgi:diguanylate cyclase (GGDEF)-like protein/PAS domain S-box-containing protein
MKRKTEPADFCAQGTDSPGLSADSVVEAVRPLEDELKNCRQEEAEEMRQRLVDFISTASDVMWEMDADLRTVSRHDPSNPEAKYDSAENKDRRGKTILEIIGRDPASDLALAAHWEDLLSRRPFRAFVYHVEREDGSMAWFEANGNPFFNKNGVFQGYRGTTRDITRRKTDEARIDFLARHDSLTDLPNRGLFRERLERSLAQARDGQSLAVMILDLDNFKTVNDTLGHSVGDAVLCAVGARLSSCVRSTDTVARLGGDEFAIAQVDLKEPDEAAALAQRIAEVIGRPYEIDTHHISASVTIGIAVAPWNGADADQLMKNADIALYRAREDDPGSWRFFESEMGLLVEARRTLETELRSALANGEFELFYQPFYNVRSREICAFEALLRWRHPLRGMVLPDQFIPLLEETGLIVPIGEWILREACAQAATWREHISVSVNLSSVQFRNTTPVKAVMHAIAASGLAASRLELEITETVLMQNDEAALDALHQLRELGARISMDDFGTGYSSLSYLRSFPFDKIKIDRSFIQDLTQKQSGIAIVRAIASLGTSLHLATTAEGVETMEQFAIVRAEGCTEVQGFFFSPPIPAKDIARLLEANSSEPVFHGRLEREYSRAGTQSMIPAEPMQERFFVEIPGHGNVFNSEAV